MILVWASPIFLSISRDLLHFSHPKAAIMASAVRGRYAFTSAIGVTLHISPGNLLQSLIHISLWLRIPVHQY
jgi:hypothetical protein